MAVINYSAESFNEEKMCESPTGFDTSEDVSHINGTAISEVMCLYER